MTALALIRLGRRTGDKEFSVKARLILNRYSRGMEEQPGAFAGMLVAAEELFTPSSSSTAAQTPVSLQLEIMPRRLNQGQEYTAVIRIRIQAGWHINASNPGDAALIGLRIQALQGPFRLLSAQYPQARSARLGF